MQCRYRTVHVLKYFVFFMFEKQGLLLHSQLLAFLFQNNIDIPQTLTIVADKTVGSIQLIKIGSLERNK